mmetsp:Transcript_11053/g.20177  ORF Transcript_11053/g.20177 Transcript_11053/m.20177 type:complete len:90 (-) Transcript_11053:748-1017(-)
MFPATREPQQSEEDRYTHGASFHNQIGDEELRSPFRSWSWREQVLPSYHPISSALGKAISSIVIASDSPFCPGNSLRAAPIVLILEKPT